MPRRRAAGIARRGVAAIMMVVLLLVVNLIVIGAVLGTARDQDLSVRRLETVQAFYAAEAGTNMAVREMMINYDDDGDGVVGSISDDGNAANDPAIGAATVLVTRTDGASNASLAAAARNGSSRRSVVADVTLEGSGIPFEQGLVAIGSTAQTVPLKKKYDDPIVVCTVNYLNNTTPVVVRVDNVGATAFDAWLQNPGDFTTPAGETVFYLVMEAGGWDVDGVKFEAQRYTSTVTDSDSSWGAEAQSYLQSYTTPVVLGQVMSAADPDWSGFWSRGSNKGNPATAGSLRTGKMVAEDSDASRADETVGFVVFESGSGTIGGIAMDARLSADNILGVDNSPPYSAPFNSAFASVPEIIVGSQTAMDGGNGGWFCVYGTPATASAANVVIDEDQIKDSERNHTSEQVMVVAFERAGVTPDVVSWAEVGP